LHSWRLRGGGITQRELTGKYNTEIMSNINIRRSTLKNDNTSTTSKERRKERMDGIKKGRKEKGRKKGRKKE